MRRVHHANNTGIGHWLLTWLPGYRCAVARLWIVVKGKAGIQDSRPEDSSARRNNRNAHKHGAPTTKAMGGTDSDGSTGTNYGVTFTNANFDSATQFSDPNFGITSAIAESPIQKFLKRSNILRFVG